MKILSLLSLLLTFVPLFAEDLEISFLRAGGSGKPTIEQWLLNRGRFSTLVDFLVAVGLAPGGPFDESGSYTLFAPTDQAFARTLRTYPGLDDVLAANPDALTTVLTYHALASKVMSGSIPKKGVTVSTLSGETLTAYKSCNHMHRCTVKLIDGTHEEKRVNVANRRASNGVIHAINKVLIPPSLADVVEGLRRKHH